MVMPSRRLRSTDPAGPRARRFARPGFGDVRLWAGIALVAVSMAAGARLMAPDDDSVVVLRATRDLSVGARPQALEPVRISRAAAGDRYLADPPEGSLVVRSPVRAGELVPRSAVAPPAAIVSRLVTVPVDPLHAPPGLQPGDVVDVWATSTAPAGAGPADPAASAPSLVLAAVTVESVSADAAGLSGRSAVVLRTGPDDVGRVVGAARSAEVDLVAVPLDSQRATTTGTP